MLCSLFIVAVCALLVTAVTTMRRWCRYVPAPRKGPSYAVAIVHPFAGGGGGGERVLWVALAALLQRRYRVVLFTARYPPPPAATGTADGASAGSERSPLNNLTSSRLEWDAACTTHLLSKIVPDQFGISLDAAQRELLEVRYLSSTKALEPESYPIARLLLQGLVGGFALAVDIARACRADRSVPSAQAQHRFVQAQAEAAAAGGREQTTAVLESSVATSVCRGLPPLVLDTVGLPFSYPWLRLLLPFLGPNGPGRIGAYVHYPWISTDMIAAVATGAQTVNNPTGGGTGRVGRLKRKAKLLYYQLIASAYWWWGGRWASGPVWCNSTWTLNHVRYMWHATSAGMGARDSSAQAIGSRAPKLLFPPANTDVYGAMPVAAHGADVFVSVGQFRPEKNHTMQLRAFAQAKKQQSSGSMPPPPLPASARLVLIGGARNAEDNARVDELAALAISLGLGAFVLRRYDATTLSPSAAAAVAANDDAQARAVWDEVQATAGNAAVIFLVNAPFSLLRAVMAVAVAGVHTMPNEHFGIVVVEYMAAGCVAIAHRSAGPEMILRGGEYGFLGATDEEFSDAMRRAAGMRKTKPEEWRALVERAREAASKYGDGGFAERFFDDVEAVTVRRA